LVLADQPHKDAASAERSDVARDVASAANIGLAALDGDDRCGRLRRNPRHLAINELIEHEVADAEHGLVGDRMRQGIKIEHRNSLSVASVARSAETIGGIEEAFDVSLDRVFQRGEAAIIAGALQPIDLALGEVLVAAANRL